MSEQVQIDMRPVAEAINRLSYKIDQLNQSILLTNSAIAAMEAALVAQISDLKKTMVNVERQKLYARTKAVGDFLDGIEEDAKEIDTRLETENDKLKQEYSTAVNRTLDHIREEIKVNVEPMQDVLGEFNSINSDFVQSTMPFSQDLKQAYIYVYHQRLSKLEELRQRIVGNFENFIGTRASLVQQIEEMAVQGIPIADNALIHIPFWLVGIQDGDSEKVIVLPVLEKYSSGKLADQREPYIEHLRPPAYFSFEELTKEVGSSENVEIARNKRISLERLKEKFQAFIQKMQQSGLIHESFGEAMEKFPEVYSDV
jgi:hypothetical protein